jgi:hypothetical protein
MRGGDGRGQRVVVGGRMEEGQYEEQGEKMGERRRVSKREREGMKGRRISQIKSARAE